MGTDSSASNAQLLTALLGEAWRVHVQRVESFLDRQPTAYQDALARLAQVEKRIGETAMNLRSTIQRMDYGDGEMQRQIIWNAPKASRSVLFAAEADDTSRPMWVRTVGIELAAVVGAFGLEDAAVERLDPGGSSEVTGEYEPVPIVVPDPTDNVATRGVELLRHSIYLEAYAYASQLQALVTSRVSDARNAVTDYVVATTLEGNVGESLRPVEHELFMAKQREIDPSVDDLGTWIEILPDDNSLLGDLYQRLESSPAGKPNGWEQFYEGVASGVPVLVQNELIVIEREVRRGVEAFVAQGFRFPQFSNMAPTAEAFGLAARSTGQASFMREGAVAGLVSAEVKQHVTEFAGFVRQELSAIAADGLVPLDTALSTPWLTPARKSGELGMEV